LAAAAARAGQPLSEDQKTQLLGGLSAPEDRLANEIKAASLRAETAQKALLAGLRQTHTQLERAIITQNQKFLDDLRKLFRQNLIDQAQLENVKLAKEQEAAARTVEQQKNLPNAIAKVFAGPVTNAEQKPERAAFKTLIRENLGTDTGKAFLKYLKGEGGQTIKGLQERQAEVGRRRGVGNRLQGAIGRHGVRPTAAGWSIAPVSSEANALNNLLTSAQGPGHRDSSGRWRRGGGGSNDAATVLADLNKPSRAVGFLDPFNLGGGRIPGQGDAALAGLGGALKGLGIGTEGILNQRGWG